MLTAIQILSVVKLVFFLLIIFIACIYFIPILLVKRLRTSINLLTVNVCLSVIVCSIYWMIFAILQLTTSENLVHWNCVYFQYFQTFVNGQEIYALANVSFHRFCIIFYYNKPQFKTLKWVFQCIAIQWLVGIILPLPIFFLMGRICATIEEPLWLRIYILFIVLFFPSVFFLCINGAVLYSAHSSRKRVAPTNPANQAPLVSNRDIRLIKRMTILICLFLIGWAPVYIVYSIQNSNTMSVEVLKFLAEMSLLGEIFNLFEFNHDLRTYLKNRFLY